MWLHCTHACVYACLLGLTTYRKFQMIAFKHFTKIDVVHGQVMASGGLLSRVQRRGPRAKMTQCGTGLCFYRRRQATNRQYKFNVDGG